MTTWIFSALIVLLALQRLYELGLSRKNEALIRLRGGREYAAWQVGAIKALHAGWFIAMLVEVYALRRPFIPGLSALALVLLMVGQGLRFAARQSLRWRWTVRVMTIPGLPPVRQGIYRYLRHPNYLGVVLEILAVPLIHSAYATAIVFSLANALLLAARIRTEDRALLDAVTSTPLALDHNP